MLPVWKISLLLLSLLRGLGRGAGGILLGGALDDERLHAHGLGGDEGDDGGVTGLDELGVVLKLLARTTIALLLDLCELAGDVSGVTVEHGAVAVGDLAG